MTSKGNEETMKKAKTYEINFIYIYVYIHLYVSEEIICITIYI